MLRRKDSQVLAPQDQRLQFSLQREEVRVIKWLTVVIEWLKSCDEAVDQLYKREGSATLILLLYLSQMMMVIKYVEVKIGIEGDTRLAREQSRLLFQDSLW